MVDDDKPLTELDSVPGDIIENALGDRFLALPNGLLAFVGNKDMSKVAGLTQKSQKPVRILRRVQLPSYREPKRAPSMEDDWDTLRGISRFRAPLPQGCTCTHDALEVVIKCGVHKVKAEMPIQGGAATLNQDGIDYDLNAVPLDAIPYDTILPRDEDDEDDYED